MVDLPTFARVDPFNPVVAQYVERDLEIIEDLLVAQFWREQRLYVDVAAAVRDNAEVEVVEKVGEAETFWAATFTWTVYPATRRYAWGVGWVHQSMVFQDGRGGDHAFGRRQRRQSADHARVAIANALLSGLLHGARLQLDRGAAMPLRSHLLDHLGGVRPVGRARMGALRALRVGRMRA